jgi:hypothetical protein
MLLLTAFDHIPGSRRFMLPFLLTEKGPMAEKRVGGPHAAMSDICYRNSRDVFKSLCKQHIIQSQLLLL